MASGPQAGWYRDPDGTPDRYRWFDGERWTDRTTTSPILPRSTAEKATGNMTTVAALVGSGQLSSSSSSSLSLLRSLYIAAHLQITTPSLISTRRPRRSRPGMRSRPPRLPVPLPSPAREANTLEIRIPTTAVCMAVASRWSPYQTGVMKTSPCHGSWGSQHRSTTSIPGG